MLERFSESAKQAVSFALEDAAGAEVGTEHLLLGLMRARDGAAAQMLARLGLTVEAVRAALASPGRPLLEAEVAPPRPRAADAATATPPTFAAWLGTALTHASAEAAADGRAIDVTDFLVALAHDPQSPSGWVLAELEIDAAKMRATAEHLRLLDREIDRVGREMYTASAAQQLDRAGALRDQRRQLIAQRQRRPAPADADEEPPLPT